MPCLRLRTIASFVLVKTLKMIESNVSWFDSAVKCSPCPCSTLDLPIVCSILGLYLLQVEPYLWATVSSGYSCCSVDLLRHSPLKCTCSSVACMGHNPSRGVPAVAQSQPRPDALRGTCSHGLQVTVPSAAAAQNWQWCPAHLPAQAHRCGCYQNISRHSRKVVRMMFFMSGFHKK